MSVKKVGNEIIVTFEIIQKYLEKDIDLEIQHLNEMIENSQSEIVRNKEELKKWENYKNLFNK